MIHFFPDLWDNFFSTRSIYFLKKFVNIFATPGAPSVSLTPVPADLHFRDLHWSL
jgi:hypothetical protein